MGCCSIEDLCKKDVINVENAACIGTVTDVEVDVCSGKLVSLLVLAQSRMSGFRKGDMLKVSWEDICVIGDDVILVKNACPAEPLKQNKLLFDIFSK